MIVSIFTPLLIINYHTLTITFITLLKSVYHIYNPLSHHGREEHGSHDKDAQPNHRVLLPPLSIGLIAISILAIIDVTNVLTIKIFLIPCPFFVGYTRTHTVSSASASSAPR